MATSSTGFVLSARHARRPRIAEAEPAPRTNVRRLVHSFRRKPKRDLIANVLYIYDMLRYTARNSSTNKCARACIIKSTERVWASTKQSSRLYSFNRHSPTASTHLPLVGAAGGFTLWALQQLQLHKSTLQIHFVFSCTAAPARLLPRRLMVFKVAQWCQAD